MGRTGRSRNYGNFGGTRNRSLGKSMPKRISEKIMYTYEELDSKKLAQTGGTDGWDVFDDDADAKET